MNCRRCDSIAPLYLINKKRHRRFIVSIDSPEWEQGYTNEGGPLDSKDKATGPYCRDCAEKRVKEFKGKDRRAQRYEDAKKTLRNVNDNDCPLIATQAVTGMHRREIEREARALGWRADKKGIYAPQVRRLMENCGVKFKTTIDSMDALIDGTRWNTVNGMKRHVKTGTYAVITYSPSGGHIVIVRDGEVINGGDRHDRVARIAQVWRIED